MTEKFPHKRADFKEGKRRRKLWGGVESVKANKTGLTLKEIIES